eukprot:gene12396-26079_t
MRSNELKSLNAELDSLGGGDARVGNLELHTIVDEWKTKGDSQTLWPLHNSIGIKQITSSNNQSNSEDVKYFPISSTSTLSSIIESPEKYSPINHLARWVLDGYNSCITVYGERDSCKSRALFGSTGTSTGTTPTSTTTHSKPTLHTPHSENPSLVHSLLQLLYLAKDTETRDGGRFVLRIGISAWALTGSNTVVDLCRSSSDPHTQNNPSASSTQTHNPSSSSLRFVTVDCPDLRSALH